MIGSILVGMCGVFAAVTVDFGTETGAVRPLNGVNNQPVRLNGDQQWELHNANVPLMRTHDTFGMWSGKYVDIPNVFPDFDADENDPANYDFAFTDRYLEATAKAGVGIFYRLGVTIENECSIKAYNIRPPKDPAKWARICEHVVRHYNEGWANGYKWNIRYWEIWNEPENPQMWTGTREEYFALYAAAAKHLRACFPEIKIGGYASSGFFAVDARYDWEKTDHIRSFVPFFEAFLAFVKKENLPFDFFSWHLYTDDPARIATHAKYVREKLDAAGFAQTESVLNEWNRIEFGSATDDTYDEMKGPKGASFAAAAMTVMQRSGVDSAMFYDALPTRRYGALFYFPSLRTTPCYEAFAAFGELRKLGTAVKAEADERGLYVAAAKSADGEGKSVMVVNYPGDGKTRTVKLDLKGGGARYSVSRIDADHPKLVAAGEVSADGALEIPPYGLVMLQPMGRLVGVTDHGPALAETALFTVTPENGVWDKEYGRTEDPKDLMFTFRLLRHRDGIAVKASVFDDRVVTDDCTPGTLSCPSWDDDNLECFFDGDNDKSRDSRAGDGLKYGGEFTFVANGAAQSDFSGWPKSFGEKWYGTVTKVALPEGGFRLDYDMFFSWECLGKKTPPKDDEKVAFGFNICVHDDDDGHRNDHALYWKGNPEIPYRDESQFGTIEF